jgi:hypothetical protein
MYVPVNICVKCIRNMLVPKIISTDSNNNMKHAI